MNTLKIGDRVNRIEDRPITGAIVIKIDGDYCEIKYNEGGSGWWPYDSLELIKP